MARTILRISPSTLKGEITVPPSKSHTLRAIVFASFAKGKSIIERPLDSPDTEAMILAMQQLGAHIICNQDRLEIEGFCEPKVPDDVIQCGNSGQVLRFVGAIAGLLPQFTILTGDHSIRHHRPVLPLLDGLSQLGASAYSARGDGLAPIMIKGPLTSNYAKIDGADSQPVSGLLIASAFAPHPITIDVINPGEKPWVAVTLDWFRKLGISYQDTGSYQMQGSSKIEPFQYRVPGDFSSAAFPIVAALITNSELIVHNLDMTDIQGDKAIVPILQKMGAKITIEDKKIILHKNSELQGSKIDINDCIDALPILAVISCFAKTPTLIFNGAIARKKESDRISCITNELRKMGAIIEEKPDGVMIYPSVLKGAHVESNSDHRLALSLSVAALAAIGESEISGFESSLKTYPTFVSDFVNIGANIR